MIVMIVFLIVICVFVQCSDGCPTGCECRIDSMWCENVDAETVFTRNVLIRSVTFVECYVDFDKVMKAFPNLKKLSFVDSVVVNCPLRETGVTITGACDGQNGKDDESTLEEWQEIEKHTIEIEVQIQTLLTYACKIAKNGWIAAVLGILSYVTIVVAAVIRLICYIKVKQLECANRRRNARSQQVELGSGWSNLRNRQIPPRTMRTRSMTQNEG